MIQFARRLLLHGGLLTIASANAVFPCGCLPEPACMFGDMKKCMRARLKGANVVFFGKVVDRDIKELEKPSVALSQKTSSDAVEVDLTPEVVRLPYSYIATIEVETGWKGFRSERVFVRAEQSDGANCGIDLKIGSSYIFFTSAHGNVYTASACNVVGGDNLLNYLPKGHRIKTY